MNTSVAWMIAGKLAVENRQLFDLLAFAGVDQKRGSFDLAAAFVVELAENGNQRDRKIIDAIEAQILEGVQDGAFAGAGETGEDDELARVAFLWRAAGHGVRR